MADPTKKEKFRPYPNDSACPCGSGSPYKRCCKRKDFKYELDRRGNVHKQIKIHPRLLPLLDEVAIDFRNVFGRKPGPKDPILFNHWLNGEDDFWQHAETVGKAAKIPEQLIFAWRRTGLIVGEHSRRLMPDVDHREWTDAIAEYFSIKDASLDPFHVFTYLSGEEYEIYKTLIERIDHVILAVGCALTNPKSFRGRSDYLRYLFFRRALSSLRTIREMYSSRYDDDCLSIARCLYETYLRMKLLRLDPSSADRFEALIARDLGKYQIKIKKNGKPNYDVAVDPETGREFNVAISNREILGVSDFPLEHNLYYDLYPSLSGFVHPDLLRIVARPSRPKERGAMIEGDPIQSAIYVGTICVLLLLEIGTSGFLKKVAKRDIGYVLKTFSETLMKFIISKTMFSRALVPPSVYSLFGLEVEYVDSEESAQ